MVAATWFPENRRYGDPGISNESGRMTKLNQNVAGKTNRAHKPALVAGLHPAWIAFIRHCRDMDFGEISQLKIQDGIPVMAEETTKKVKFI